MIVDELPVPIVLAPLAGGPSTPALTAAVSAAGGLGMLASGYLAPEQTAAAIAEVRGLSDRPFGVNLFVPGDAPADPAVYGPYLERLREWAAPRGLEPGAPRHSDDGWEQKLELLVGDPVAVVSFAFGCPPAEVLERLRRAGSETWVTVTSPAEAEQADAAGADVLVVQGAEAGGHRGSFRDVPELPVIGLLPLLQLVRARTRSPLVAAGGIATGAGVAAAMAGGAAAAQVGTALMLATEAGTSPAHRAAIAAGAPTALTRAFTGRLARGIRNEFMEAHTDAPIAYPEIHYATAPLRAAARAAGDPRAINLWAGEAHELAREQPAGELVMRLAAEAREALERAAAAMQRPRPQQP
jgi:nitronate monooxygenase